MRPSFSRGLGLEVVWNSGVCRDWGGVRDQDLTAEAFVLLRRGLQQPRGSGFPFLPAEGTVSGTISDPP